MRKKFFKFAFLGILTFIFCFIFKTHFSPQTAKSTDSSYKTKVGNNCIELTTVPYLPANDSFQTDIDTTKCFPYVTTTLNNYTIDVYRNSQNNLIVSSTDAQGNSSILTSYKDWNNYCFEEFESSLLKYNFSLCSPYDNLFGTQSLAMEFPVGANAILYIIIGEQNENIQLLFQNIDSGLIIDNIDNDKDLELISTLNGYFYDKIDDDLYQYNIVLPENVLQLVWDEQEHKAHLYYTDKTQKMGLIDTANLEILF